MGIWFKVSIKTAHFCDQKSYEIGTFEVFRPCCFKGAQCPQISQEVSTLAWEKRQQRKQVGRAEQSKHLYRLRGTGESPSAYDTEAGARPRRLSGRPRLCGDCSACTDPGHAPRRMLSVKTLTFSLKLLARQHFPSCLFLSRGGMLYYVVKRQMFQ